MSDRSRSRPGVARPAVGSRPPARAHARARPSEAAVDPSTGGAVARVGGIHARIDVLDDDALALVLAFAGPDATARFASTSAASWRRAVADPPPAIDSVWATWCAARWGRHARASRYGSGARRGRGDGAATDATDVPGIEADTSGVADAGSHVPVPAAGPRAAFVPPLPPPASEYCAFRRSRWRPPTPPPSPLDLIQEAAARAGCGDAWSLLATCMLCSRTAGGPAVRATVAAFFAAYPTPSSVLDADPGALGALLAPLGLRREVALARAAAGFVDRAWTGASPTALFGCGAFAQASWRVWVRGDAAAVARDGAADRTVRAYAAWAVRAGAGADAGVGARAAGGSRASAASRTSAPAVRGVPASQRRAAPNRGASC